MTYWKKLKNEIYRVREKGYENTDIVKVSEKYFEYADRTVTAAERYSEKIAGKIRSIEYITAFDMALIVLLLIAQYIDKLNERTGRDEYYLALTNREVYLMFENMIYDWFGEVSEDYNDFINGLLQGDVDAMNQYMNQVSKYMFSYFDTGKKGSDSEPERFYHGFVLGLMVELEGRYVITSNRESGFGRYDVMLEPVNRSEDAIIIEFKVRNKRKEASLEETVRTALKQIEEKEYEAELVSRGFKREKIRKYEFAFEGKNVLIGEHE